VITSKLVRPFRYACFKAGAQRAEMEAQKQLANQ
jgi:hypothetical protein